MPVLLTVPTSLVTAVKGFGPITVPDTLTSVQISVDISAHTVATTALTVNLDFSLDGVTYASASPSVDTDPFPITWKRKGDSAVDRNAIPITTSVGTFTLPHPELATRTLKGTLVLLGPSTNFALTISAN